MCSRQGLLRPKKLLEGDELVAYKDLLRGNSIVRLESELERKIFCKVLA